MRGGSAESVARDDQLGPIAEASATLALFLAVVVGLQTLPAPSVVPFAILALSAGSVILAPEKVLARIPVPFTILFLLTWICLSYLWSHDPIISVLFLKRDIPVLISVMLCVGILSIDRILLTLVAGIRAIVAISLIATILIPSTRLHFDPTGLTPDLPGWHALFQHKNTMTPVLLIGLTTVAVLDRNRYLRLATIIGIAILLIGSDSGTGLAGALLVVAGLTWVTLYSRYENRLGTAFVVTSLSVVVVGIVSVITSMSTVVEAYGKDVTFTGRTFIWAAAMKAIRERPIEGYGIGGLLWGSDPPTAETAAAWREIGFRVPHSHNGVLDMLVQYGLVGLVLFSLVFATTMGAAWKLARDHGIGRFIVTTLVVLAFVSISEPVFANQWLIIYVVLQVLMCRCRWALRRHESLPNNLPGLRLWPAAQVSVTTPSDTVAAPA